MSLRSFDLEVYFARYEEACRHNLASSNPQPLTQARLLEYASENQLQRFHDLSLAAVPTFGSDSLRTEIARRFDSISCDDLLCFAGAEEGIYVAMQVLLGRGDHCIVVTPNYQAAETLPASLCEVSALPLRADDHWAFDLDRLRDTLRANTRMISINFPHNPTGKLISRQTLTELVEICDRRGIYLFSDEVYRGLEFDECSRLPNVADIYDRGLSLNVTSKALALPGLRVGWIACRERELLQDMERFKHYLSICNSTPSELLAEIALANADRIIAHNLQAIRRNLDLLSAFMSAHAEHFHWSMPDAGCIGFPEYTGPGGGKQFVERARQDAGVFMLPGCVFRSELGFEYPNHFRISFGRDGVADSLAALERLFPDRVINA